MITLDEVLSISKQYKEAVDKTYLCDTSERFKELWTTFKYEIIQQAALFVKEKEISTNDVSIGDTFLFATWKSDSYRKELRTQFLDWWISKLQNESILS